jgi:crossover junction endodeoxyribonuclease RuvC
MRVLGLDPGTIKMGWAVIESLPGGLRKIRSGTFRERSGDLLQVRLYNLSFLLHRLGGDYKPDAIAVEGGFTGQNPRSGLMIGMARGLAYVLAGAFDVPLTEYAPASIKKAIGQHGRADKDIIMRAVNELFPSDAAHRIVDLDESDAIAVAVTHLNVVEGVGMLERSAM